MLDKSINYRHSRVLSHPFRSQWCYLEIYMSINTLKVDVQNALTLKNDRLLRDAEVQKLTGVRKTRRADLMRDGKFPLPIKICGGRTNYWLASEIEKFIADQVALHRTEQAEKLAQLASDPFNVLMNALAGKPNQNSQGACDA